MLLHFALGLLNQNTRHTMCLLLNMTEVILFNVNEYRNLSEAKHNSLSI